MSEITQVEQWIDKEFTQLKTFIIGEEKVISPYLSIAENIVNGIKSFEGSEIGKISIGALESFIPASTGLINAFNEQLPVWIVGLNWAVNETGKTPDAQLQDAVTYLKSITDPDIYAAQLNTLKALISKFFTGNDGVVPLSIQQALTLAQPSHSAAVLS